MSVHQSVEFVPELFLLSGRTTDMAQTEDVAELDGRQKRVDKTCVARLVGKICHDERVRVR